MGWIDAVGIIKPPSLVHVSAACFVLYWHHHCQKEHELSPECCPEPGTSVVDPISSCTCNCALISSSFTATALTSVLLRSRRAIYLANSCMFFLFFELLYPCWGMGISSGIAITSIIPIASSAPCALPPSFTDSSQLESNRGECSQIYKHSRSSQNCLDGFSKIPKYSQIWILSHFKPLGNVLRRSESAKLGVCVYMSYIYIHTDTPSVADSPRRRDVTQYVKHEINDSICSYISEADIKLKSWWLSKNFQIQSSLDIISHFKHKINDNI